MSEAVAAAVTTENTSAPAVASEQAIPTAPNPGDSGAAAASPPERKLTSREVMEGLQRGESLAPRETQDVAPPSEAPVAPEVKVDALGNLHAAADGRFVAKDSAEPETPEVSGDANAEATDPVPAGFVKIPLPEGHALRDRGRDFILAPEGQEAEYRGLVGANARRAEVEQAQRRIAELEETLLREKSRDAARRKVQADPQTLRAIEEVRAVDAGLAELMEAGLEAKVSQTADEEFRTMADERIQQEVAQESMQFLTDAFQYFQTSLPVEISQAPRFQEHFDQARYLYGAELQRRAAMNQSDIPSRDEFGQFLRSSVLQDPQIAGALRQRMTESQKAEQERIAAEAKAKAAEEAKERERQQLEAATQKRKTNPFGGLAVKVGTSYQAPTEKPMSSAEYMRSVLR